MPFPGPYTGSYGQGYGSVKIKHDTNRHNHLVTTEEHWAQVAVGYVVNNIAYGEPAIEWAFGCISGAEGYPPGAKYEE